MKTPTILGHKPKVPNKYGLIGSDINHMVLLDRTNVGKPTFWRNNVINAWCISASSGNDLAGDEFWLGIYDEPYHQKLVRAYFTSYGGMWMPFARYRRGQGTNAREITDFCPTCGAQMFAIDECETCKYSEGGNWQENGICYACRGDTWIFGKKHNERILKD